MRQKPETSKDAAGKLVKNIRRKTRQTYSAEERSASALLQNLFCLRMMLFGCAQLPKLSNCSSENGASAIQT